MTWIYFVSFQLLEEICSVGQDPRYVCQKQQPKSDQVIAAPRSPQPVDGGSSEEEDEDEELPAAPAAQPPAAPTGETAISAAVATESAAADLATAPSTSGDGAGSSGAGLQSASQESIP
jgi:hypothetical protein